MNCPPSENMAPEALWTAVDVAAFLKVSRSWVYSHAAAGDLPSLHVGGLLRFDPERIRAWVQGSAHGGARVIPLQSRG